MDNVSLAQRYLEDKVSGGGLSNYSMCLAAYALALANSPLAGTALNDLRRRADLISKTSGSLLTADPLKSRTKSMRPWFHRRGDDVELLGRPALGRLAASLSAGGDDLLRAAGVLPPGQLGGGHRAHEVVKRTEKPSGKLRDNAGDEAPRKSTYVQRESS